MLRFLSRTAMVKGVFGGDRRWFALWSALAVLRLVRRAISDAPEVVYRHQLDPGEAVVIRSEAPSGGRRRK
jgi:hypothetical protein